MPLVNGDAAGPSSGRGDSVATMKKRNKPQYHPFTQQQLPACKPILAPHTVIPVLAFVGLIFIPIGLACIAASNKVVEVVDQYDTKCVPGNMLHNKVAYIQNPSMDKTCTRILKVKQIPKDMKKPIYIYYQLDKFYQNHRRYVKSRNNMQLRNPKMVNDTQYCKPEATANGGPIVPCGLIAWSLFNDTYSFARGNQLLKVNKQGISWRSEREHIFGKHVYPKNFQNGTLIGGGQLDPSKPVSFMELVPATTINVLSEKSHLLSRIASQFLSFRSSFQYGTAVLYVLRVLLLHFKCSSTEQFQQLSEQEDLIVWMRTAALPTFRKLYGRIEVDLQAGELITVTMQNNYNSYNFDGKKTLVLSTTGWLGGKNTFLGRAYVIVGMTCFLLALLLTLLCVIFPMKEEHLLLRYPSARVVR